jgi:hypothetical protein
LFFTIQKKIAEKIVFKVKLADSHVLSEFAAGDLHLMLLVTPTDVPYLKVVVVMSMDIS